MVSNMATLSHGSDQTRMLGLDKEDMHRFSKILRILNFDNVPHFASNVRLNGHPSTCNSPAQDLSEPCSISCKVINPPLYGSFHIVFPIEFADGVKWMLKVPANGDHFDSVTASALASEARTMQMLRRETSIPVPAVYAFDTSSDNALSCPFILMEKLGGTQLFYLWFNPQVPKARLEHFRIKALQSLARAMVQLNNFNLNKGGSLVFGSDGTPIGLGGAKTVDGVAIFNKATASKVHQKDRDGGVQDTSERIRVEATKPQSRNASGSTGRNADDSDDNDIIYERAPFSRPREYFTSNLDRSDPAFRADAYERGTDLCLRLFIEWAFANSHDERFVLTHPDLDVQNILVADDGTLTGLIDWDGVAAVPREVGCAQYPLWLMRDWVPLRYNYDTDRGKACADAGYEESSPAELASYRALYAQFMEAEIEKMTGGANRTTTLGTLPKQEAELTRRSLVMRNLDLSAGDPWVALGTVNHIIDQIEELTAPEWEDTDSDADSISSYSSDSDDDSDSNSTVGSDIDQENTEVEGPGTNEQVLGGIKDDASIFQAGQATEGTEPIVPEITVKFKHSSWEEAEHSQVSTISSERRQTEVEEPEMQKGATMVFQDNSSTTGWTRRFLRFGCNTAERSLRRIARMGYVLKDTIDEVAEMSTEVEVQHSKASTEGVIGHVMEFDARQPTTATETFRDIGMKHPKDVQSTQDTVEAEQLSDVPRNGELDETSSAQAAVQSQQTKATTSVQPTVEAHNIPSRKAELLQAEKLERKAERKANYRASKAAIKQELKVWDRIALAVWCRGIPLELLQKKETKIARWVVDTLKAEQAQGENLAVDSPLPSASERVAAAGEMVDSSTTAQSPVEDDAMPSNEVKEVVRPQEDVLQVAKVKGDEPSETSEVTVGGFAGDYGLEPNVHQSPLGNPIMTTQDDSVPENIMLDTLEDSEDEPESATTTIQPQASLNFAQKSCTSKPNGDEKRAEEPAATEGDKISPLLGNENPSSSTFSACTTVPNNPVPSNQPEISSNGDDVAGGPNVRQKNIVLDKKHSQNLAAEIEVQPLAKSSPEFGGYVLPVKVKFAYSLRALFKSWNSYFAQTFFNHNHSKADKGYLSPSSSVPNGNGDEGRGSDIEDTCSSATSLSDGEAEDRDNQKIKEDKDDMPEVAVFAADEGDMGQTNHRKQAAFNKLSFKEDEPTNSCTARRVYDTCNGDWVEANKFDDSTKIGSTTTTADDVQVRAMIDAGDGRVEGDTNNEGRQEDRACEDEGDGSSSDLELPEFEDHGGFDRYTVCNLLGMGELDELRLLRLKEGFLKLLEQY